MSHPFIEDVRRYQQEYRMICDELRALHARIRANTESDFEFLARIRGLADDAEAQAMKMELRLIELERS